MIKWILVLIPFAGWSQSFAPEPGITGSTAIHKDSSAITFWADNVTIERGFLDIADQSQGYASYGVASDAEGPADGISVVSLGDGGIATYYFSEPVSDGNGPDFAIFENGFADHYIELAFVEVSSDDLNYFRFPAISEAPTVVQLSNFDFSNCRYFYNLAGKYRANYGTPFDLAELDSISGLDINAITSIRIIDVVGSINPNYGTTDDLGTLINDTYPTAFPSGGFDLDALALLQPYSLGISELEKEIICYPNPVQDVLYFSGGENVDFQLFDNTGRLVESGNSNQVEMTGLNSGMYTLKIMVNGAGSVHLIQKIQD